MNREELETWANGHNYPQLVLGRCDVVKPGRAEWEKLLVDTTGRINKALDRVETFLKRVEKERVLTS